MAGYVLICLFLLAVRTGTQSTTFKYSFVFPLTVMAGTQETSKTDEDAITEHNVDTAPFMSTTSPTYYRPSAYRVHTIPHRKQFEEDVCSLFLSTTSQCNDGVSTYWYYDHGTGMCKELPIRECNSNRNSFNSKAQCEGYCSQDRVCQLLTLVTCEWCHDGMPSWTYNSRSGNYGDVCSLSLSTTSKCNSAVLAYWYYDRHSGMCEEISNGECNSNSNSFTSQRQCEGYCSQDRVCQPLIYTSCMTCLALITGFTYNSLTGHCELFTYGGCFGSANNFATKEACDRKCGPGSLNPLSPASEPVSHSEIFAMPEKAGDCLSHFRKWSYDSLTGQCVVFTYSGCGGNKNNFNRKEECELFCSSLDVCSLSLSSTSECNNGVSSYWYYEHDTGMCKELPNGECNSNRNSFNSKAQCEGYCSQYRVCQPLTYATHIRCNAAIPNWTYNNHTGTCESFDYGGCGGSANNFGTKQACHRKCGPGSLNPVATAPEPVYRSEICTMPENAGDCLAHFRKWTYDSLTGQCVEFTYGGCGGNKNKFNRKEECENFCSSPEVCQSLTYATNIRCNAIIPNWTYNSHTGKCESFTYGGCGASANNFATKEACDRKCGSGSLNPVTQMSHSEICAMPESAGHCMAHFRKWRYDGLTGQCVKFSYGGYGGNENNFNGKEECESFCSRREICKPLTYATSGRCYCTIFRWTYNSHTGHCELFNYGGCGASANNFATKEACDRKCGSGSPNPVTPAPEPVSRSEICVMPESAGNGLIP